jgi:hypothetical protein
VISQLYKNINYKPQINNIICENIREYDISKANITMLYSANIISLEEYNTLYNADRMQRQVTIGYLIKKNPQYNKVIQQGILEAKKNLFEANNIEDKNVLSIKNDAVFLINTAPSITKFGLSEFKLKNEYTSFFIANNMEFFYYLDMINNIERLDIKGINTKYYLSKVYPLHKDYFIEFLLTLFETLQNGSIQEGIEILSTFYNKYINRELSVEYYRELNTNSQFKITNMGIVEVSYTIDRASQNELKYLDINHNRLILSDLNKILTGIYISKFKRK